MFQAALLWTVRSYDAVGNAVTQTNVLSPATVTGYNALNRPIRAMQNYLGEYNLITGCEHDEAGNQVVVTDALGRMTWTQYDPLRRLVTVTQNYLPGQGQNHEIQHNLATVTEYDSAGNRVAVTETLREPGYRADDLLFMDGFESGDFTAWDDVTRDQGDLSVTTAAALTGTYGMQAVLDDTQPLGVITESPVDESPDGDPRYRARFFFDPNGVSMPNGSSHTLLKGASAPDELLFRVTLGYSQGAGYRVRADIRNDGWSWSWTNWYNITDAPHAIEIDWTAASAPGANDGSISLWVDGQFQQTRGSIDNDTWRTERVHPSLRSGQAWGRRASPRTRPGQSTTLACPARAGDGYESRTETYIGTGGSCRAPASLVDTSPALASPPASCSPATRCMRRSPNRAGTAIERVEVRLPSLPAGFGGLTIVQLSHYHYWMYVLDGEERPAVDAANALRPDLMVLTSDYVVETADDVARGAYCP